MWERPATALNRIKGSGYSMGWARRCPSSIRHIDGCPRTWDSLFSTVSRSFLPRTFLFGLSKNRKDSKAKEKKMPSLKKRNPSGENHNPVEKEERNEILLDHRELVGECRDSRLQGELEATKDTAKWFAKKTPPDTQEEKERPLLVFWRTLSSL